MIQLLFQGIPLTLSVDDLSRLDEIRAGLLYARKLGFEGQPIPHGFGKRAKPAITPPVRNQRQELCCPQHAYERRGELREKQWASGTVYACGHKDEHGWCTYKLDAATYAQFAQTIPAADPVTLAQQQFYQRYAALLGGATWAHVRTFWKDATLQEPTTVTGWETEAKELAAALQRT